MNDKYYIANFTQMDKRKLLAEEFYINILEPEEIPYAVTDEACLYDFFIGNELKLIEKVKKKYGVDIEIIQFKKPFWRLLEFLNANRK